MPTLFEPVRVGNIIRRLNKRNLAYLHIGFEETPATDINWHRKLRPLYRATVSPTAGLPEKPAKNCSPAATRTLSITANCFWRIPI